MTIRRRSTAVVSLGSGRTVVLPGCRWLGGLSGRVSDRTKVRRDDSGGGTRLSWDTDVEPASSGGVDGAKAAGAEDDGAEAAGAESDEGGGNARVHCVYSVLQTAPRNLCEKLQHPHAECLEIGHHDATLDPTCQSLAAET